MRIIRSRHVGVNRHEGVASKAVITIDRSPRLKISTAMTLCADFGATLSCVYNTPAQLFYTSEASIKPHFDHLSSLGVDQMTYVNHEAVPTRETINDYFSEVELFRVNHLVLPLSHEVRECTRFWRQKRQHGQYMLAYDNGKSAVRVLPGRIVPQSVHRWRTLRFEERDAANETRSKTCPGEAVRIAGPEASGKPTVGTSAERSGAGENCRIQPASAEGIENKEHKASGNGLLDEGRKGEQAPLHPPLANRSAMADPRELRFEEVLECSDPCVLHYPCCGLDWLRDKYRLLGSFPSSWFGGKLPIAPCFHLDARDALDRPKVNGSDSGLATGCSENKLDAGRELYRREVMLGPEEYSEQVHLQLKHGVLRSISGAANMIKQIRGSGADLDPAATQPIASGVQQVEQLNTTIYKRRMNHDALELHSKVTAQMVPFTTESRSLIYPEMGVDDEDGDATSMPELDNGAPPGAEAAAPGFDNSWILAAVARQYL